MNNILNFSDKKKKYLPSVIHVGDLIEWQDWNGQVYDGIVVGIEHLPLEGLSVGQKLDSFPLWEKDDYSVTFRNGLQVTGSAIIGKVIRKGFKIKKPFGGFTYAN